MIVDNTKVKERSIAFGWVVKKCRLIILASLGLDCNNLLLDCVPAELQLEQSGWDEWCVRGEARESEGDG